jgi:hypothetical protein
MRGDKKPGPKYRPGLREHYGVEEHWWDELPPPADPVARPAPRPPAAPSSASRPSLPKFEAKEDDARAIGGSYALARELEELARQQLAEVSNDMSLPVESRTMAPSEAAKVTRSIVPTLSHLARLTGQYDIGRKLLQLPLWKRIEREIALALAPFPEAARALAVRLRELEAAERGDS